MKRLLLFALTLATATWLAAEPTVQQRCLAGAVRRIDEALTLLTGMACGRRRKNATFTPGSLYALVDNRLEQLGDYAQNAFRRSRKNS